MMVNRRVLIVMEEGAKAKFLFCDHTADDHDFLATQVIEAYVGDNASLDLYCMEETHYKNHRVSNVYIEQQRDSRVNHNAITLHNGVTRNRLDLAFKGEGAECYWQWLRHRGQETARGQQYAHRPPGASLHEQRAL